MDDSGTKENEEHDVVFEEENGDASFEYKLKKLREELKRCQKERDEYLAGWQRSKADFINARKEEEKIRGDIIKFAKKDLILEILSVADSFDMAFMNKEAWEKVDKDWRTGVEYIYGQLLGILEQNGVKQLNPIEEIFDPNIHTSIENVPTDKEEEDHKIISVVQKGYSLYGTLLRSPKVKVAAFER